jgi:hypothetical protein
MVSVAHEGLVDLFRKRPKLVMELLRDVLQGESLQLIEPRPTDPTLNELVAAERDADAVVLFGGDKPTSGAIIEVQLWEDDRKRFTWPYYAVAARARHEWSAP